VGAFWAILKDEKGLVSFSGTKEVQPSRSRYTFFPDKLLLNGKPFGTEPTEPIVLNFQGSCDFYGDFSNEVSTFKCRGISNNRSILEYEFVTDGTPPEVTQY
jgi:hypothetical protein